MNGILIVNKPKGLTSSKVIGILKHACGREKTGHTGTLDPNATGVLPVCFGNATKVCGFLTDTTKEYVAELILGKETDSYDITGNVVAESDKRVTKEELEASLESFRGTIMQVPPMFSAKWKDGERLYDLARKGVVVDREAKEITISRLEIKDVSLKDGAVERAHLLVECSKGTYIRSLCHDIGEKLGSFACMGDLTRTRVGIFGIENSVTLEEAVALAKSGEIEEKLISADSVYTHPCLTATSAEANHLLVNGNRIPKKLFDSVTPGLYRMYDKDGVFCAIYELKEHAKYMYPYVVFPRNL
ncbi:MAG: tRNA pseudouridine(55) synthase TruB [Lachnospiraceae bacterium]|nr:tRNA pseudouridine(55) synthase TruB [Lachnospiraceae bacterium]MBP5183747.1 tRNA pseudouridine(55) synthase TruB [Lachnospiraceae bacterium]